MYFSIVSAISIILMVIVPNFLSLLIHNGDRTRFFSPISLNGKGRKQHEQQVLRARRVSPNPDEGENMEEYRRAVLKVLKEETSNPNKFDGQDLLQLIVKKWGVAYDLQLRKSKPFGEASKNIYINVMWRYYGQRSFPMSERQYMEHLEAITRYLSAIDRVEHFKEKVDESRKRPNAYFGYAVGIPLDVDPDTADSFFKDLTYD